MAEQKRARVQIYQPETDACGGQSESEDEGTWNESEGLAAKLNLDERAFEDKKRAVGHADDQDNLGDAQDSNLNLLADYPDDTEELELTHARLRTLVNLKLERFGPTLKRLCLRQNLLPALTYTTENDDTDETQRYAPLESLSELEELDLYDNRISKVAGLKGLTKLQSLDLSYNLLKRIPADELESLKSLRVIYFIQNRIREIEGLEQFSETLTSVELGGNKLKKIENIAKLTKLMEIWLGKNKIPRLEGMDTLVNLKILSIQSNRIVKLEGLECLTALEELYLSHNGISKLENLEKNTKLRVLDIASNRITKIENISHLADLEEFWANNNSINALEDVESQLTPLKNLETVYLEGNPLQKTLGTAYRRKLMLALPQVQQIDATYTRTS